MKCGIVRVCFSALCGLGLLVSNVTAAENDWLQWRGVDRANHSPDKGLLKDWTATPPKLLWMGEGCGNGYASVSLADGKIFTTGNTPAGQSVIAFNAADGSKLWSVTMTEKNPKHGYEGSRSTPTVDGDRLYVVSSSGKIVCLKTEDGKPVWEKEFTEWKGKMMSGWGFSESPLIDGNKVVFTPGGPEAMIVALDKMTGEELWKSALPSFGDKGKDGAGYSSMVISEAAGVRQYVQLAGRGVFGVRADNGQFLWGYNKVANGTANIPTPVVKGDFVFASSGYQTGSALLKLSKEGDGVKAEEVYFLDPKTLQNHHGGMVLVGDHIYCGTGHNNGFPICVEMATGKVVWGGNNRGPGGGSAAVIYADGNLIFRYQSGEVALIEATPESYNLKGVLKPEHQEKESWAHPVVIGGRMYLREQDKLMCYDLKAGS